MSESSNSLPGPDPARSSSRSDVFTPEQVKNLDEYQRSEVMHPFTCANRGDGKHYGEGKLTPTVRGWICQCCDYIQDWAHDFMLDGSAVKNDPLAAFRSERPLRPSDEAMMHARMYAASDMEAKHVSVMARELVRLSERKEP